MNNTELQIDLINGPIVRSIILFTIPLFVSYIFQQFYNAADIFIIGKYLQDSSLTAMGACTALYELLVGFGVGFGNGMSIVAARAYGAGDTETLKKITASSLVITVTVSIFVMAVTQLWLKPVMVLLDTPAESLEEAYSYISVITTFVGVLFLYNLFSGMLRAIGNSVVPLLFLVLASVINVVLDIIFVENFGIRGAAFATVLAQLVSALLCLVYIGFGAKVLIPSLKHFKPDPKLYKELAAQGLSMAFMGAIVHTGTVILQKAINSLDPLIVAGHLCARKIFTLTNIPIVTLGLASSTFVSQNLGAGKIERIKKGVKYSIYITLVWTVFLFIPAWFGVEHLVRFISSSTKDVLINYASNYIKFMVPFYLILGGLIIIRNSLQGMGSKILPLISSVIEFIGKIVFTWLIIPLLGEWGVILCEPLIWCIMFAQLAFVFFKHPLLQADKKRE